MTLTETVQPRIDTHLLTELPHFFGGFRASVRELLQNSIRAGATHIQFETTDHGFSVQDNGHGLDDPQLLLTAARSGWGAHVTDPAGLGILSLLNPEWSSAVTFRSKDWSFTLTPEQFMRADKTEVQHSEAVLQGFRVEVQLHRPQNLKETLQDLRIDADEQDIYVTLNGESTGQVAPFNGLLIETDAGRVILSERLYSVQIDWEKLSVPADKLRILLKEDPLIEALLSRYGLRLYPKSGSGIRPKLPDRESVIHNEALETAAIQITAALRERVLQEARDWAANRVDISEESIRHAGRDEVPHTLLTNNVTSLALKELGYQRVRSESLNVEINIDDDGDKYNDLPGNHSCDFTLRPTRRCGSEHWLTQEALLRGHGGLPLVSLDGDGEEWSPSITAHTHQLIPPQVPGGFEIVLADDLRLDGCSVPFAVCETSGVVYLQRREDGSDVPRAILDAAGTLALQRVILTDETGDYDPLEEYFDLHEPDSRITGRDIGRLLQEQLRATLKADEVERERQLEVLNRELRRLTELERIIQNTAAELGAQAQAAALLDRLAGKRQAVQEEVQSLKQETA
ncbi:hypothetical protein GCM10017783_23040 [Deinococcus piscis]|uniref:ATP-binding protein n=1 Tax=Deinococcus piscis TaxID=394230 RepID=A0ABQ3KB83_9DEIO|nr:hypothetical protein [Deinococcus piscis]GHG09923.1 hypothetical protein GCM10017783_23040 [Deinococcus piscis]